MNEENLYFYNLVLNHEEMHSETLHHIRQTLKYSAPKLTGDYLEPLEIDENFEFHDVDISGGKYLLGGTPDQPFIFDNEKLL